MGYFWHFLEFGYGTSPKDTSAPPDDPPSDPAPAPAPIDVHTANRCSHSSHQIPRHPEMQITGPR